MKGEGQKATEGGESMYIKKNIKQAGREAADTAYAAGGNSSGFLSGNTEKVHKTSKM